MYYSDNVAMVSESPYYGESVSSAGTTARLVPPYSLPVVYGSPVLYPGEDFSNTLEKTKRKKGKPRSMRKEEPILGYQDDSLHNPGDSLPQHKRVAGTWQAGWRYIYLLYLCSPMWKLQSVKQPS